MADFAAEVRRLMTERAISLRRLAKAASYDPSYLSKVLSGYKPSSPYLAARLDDALSGGGTNQAAPAQIAAARYHAGAAPLVITTGGINRHTGIIEGREFARQLTQAGVPDSVIRVEDQSKDTWQNVELSLPHLRKALAMGLRLAVVSKWYHLRTVYCLATQLPEAAPFYAISWEPLYAGTLVTRTNWPKIPDGRRRVLRESQEVPRRVAEGTYRAVQKADDAWQLS